MSIINTHDITLYGGTGEYDIILRPLCDDHLPLLYKWNTDPDVLYWSDGDDVQAHDADTVHNIYGKSSQTGFCFIVEVSGSPVGECWLCKMNLKRILELHPDTTDVRRIDMVIGEKAYWNKGIGTALVRMLVDYAYNSEYVDVLYGMTFDFNERSRRVFEKCGFQFVMREAPAETSAKVREEVFLRLTRAEYIGCRRFTVPPEKTFELLLTDIQPSQLWISEGKLWLARDWFNPADKATFDPIPVKLYKDRYLMTDGHTRAVLAKQAGWETVPVAWDDDPFDMLAYSLDVEWCDEAGIYSAADLSGRIVSHKDYETLWRKRCHYLEIPPSYAAIVARYGGLDGRRNVIILTDNTMLEAAQLIQSESALFVKKIDIINLDDTDDYSTIYTLAPDDLLILHVGIESWTDKHRKMAHAFDKPEGVVAKYICIRPTVTPRALLEGLNTPYEVTDGMIKRYGNLPTDKPVRVTSKPGSDITLTTYEPWTIPYTTYAPGANAYLPPAEVSYSVRPGSANGVIVVNVTVGELRVHADLIDPFGLVDEPVVLRVENGEIIDITGGIMAQKLKTELWKLPDSCRKIVELGIGLSRMTSSGIIGIDESIAGTCHFGVGRGSGNNAPIHLDVVVSEFSIN